MLLLAAWPRLPRLLLAVALAGWLLASGLHMLCELRLGHPPDATAPGWNTLVLMARQMSLCAAAGFLLHNCIAALAWRRPHPAEPAVIATVAIVLGCLALPLAGLQSHVPALYQSLVQTLWSAVNASLVLLVLAVCWRLLPGAGARAVLTPAALCALLYAGLGQFQMEHIDSHRLARYFMSAHLARGASLMLLAPHRPTQWARPEDTPVGPRETVDLMQRMLVRERRRIAQDIHDGVASQLVNIIATLDVRQQQHKGLVIALEQCLLDLKLSIDQMGNGGHTRCLTDALATLRYRLQGSLQRLDMALEWEIRDFDALDALPPARVADVLKIVQEALANAMRHAQASAVRLSCGLDATGRCVVLEVADNGRGISRRQLDAIRRSGASARGNGLRSMQRRAQQLDASLRLESRLRGGTTYVLSVPLRSAAPDL